MTVQELKVEAKSKKEAGDFDAALELYSQLWKLEKNEWNGYFLAQCLRKKENFDEARKLHIELEKSYPNFKPLKNDKLWLDYSEKIKNWDNPNLIEDAESILTRSDRYDKYTSSVYTKTVLNVIKRLTYLNKYQESYQWLLKLDQSVISNSVFNFNGQTYPADRKVFFIRYADILIELGKHIDYIDKCLINLNFSNLKQLEFKKHIIKNITFDNYISRVRLARHLKNFQEEFHLRLKKVPKIVYNANKTTLVSDLSHFLFCPVSFAINETFKIDANSSWEKDEWLGEKKLFIDRHKLFHRTNSIESSFEECEIIIDDKLKKDFTYLFNSKIRVNNATNPKPIIYTNGKGDMKGTPDYVMEDVTGVKYAITEKFSSKYSADSKAPFDSDLVKHFAFSSEFQKEKIQFGFLITWYWHLTDIQTNNSRIKKKIVINSYRLTKIERNQSNDESLQRTKSNVESFKKDNSMKIDGKRISFVNKCLNCSVFSYCNHKTGRYDIIKLPYDLNSNQVSTEPQIEFDKEEKNKDNSADDLPF